MSVVGRVLKRHRAAVSVLALVVLFGAAMSVELLFQGREIDSCVAEGLPRQRCEGLYRDVGAALTEGLTVLLVLGPLVVGRLYTEEVDAFYDRILNPPASPREERLLRLSAMLTVPGIVLLSIGGVGWIIVESGLAEKVFAVLAIAGGTVTACSFALLALVHVRIRRSDP